MTAASGRRQGRNRSQDLIGTLTTQTGHRTTAPMWARPLLTPGEWAIYTALWSYPTGATWPTHQDLADRSWSERSTVVDAVAKFDALGLIERDGRVRDDGSTTSNDYFLIEICTPDLASQIEQKRLERAAVQDKKRRDRKAKSRTYSKKAQVSGPEIDPGRGYGVGRTPPNSGPDGGTVQNVPPGYGAERTPGGTVHTGPGYGVDRTHESLGVTEGSKGSISTATPSASNAARVTAPSGAGQDPKEQENPDLSQIDNQEIEETKDSVLNPKVFPTLTEWEISIVDECLPLAGARWSRSAVTKVLGSKTIREITDRDPELVRRAFLLGAKNRTGVTVPMRMWFVEKCPHWREAEAQLAQERGEVDETPPARPSLPPAGRPSVAKNDGESARLLAEPLDAKAARELARAHAAAAAEIRRHQRAEAEARRRPDPVSEQRDQVVHQRQPEHPALAQVNA